MTKLEPEAEKQKATQRFYYTDPLAAAWMAKHFGMKIEALEYSGNDSWFEMYFAAKLYIHPDSLNLLEPQPGDFGWDANNTFCAAYADGVFSLEGTCTGEGQLRIIQRHGIPFMWPQEGA